jgi:hypothetical protein
MRQRQAGAIIFHSNIKRFAIGARGGFAATSGYPPFL